MSDKQEHIPLQELPVQKPDEPTEAEGSTIAHYYCALRETPTRIFAPV